jgi:5-methyltetrahydropteroyltriglutamate--homocysteine methyltransferase
MAYAAAVNAEIKDLHAAGADVVQMGEPYMQARPDDARAYGLQALEAALDGVTGTTAVHICFGYAAIIHSRPEGYSFLPELGGCSADQISIETAQSGLDLGVLSDLADKTVILGVIDLSDHEVDTADTVADRVRRAFDYTTPDKVTIATDCGMKYLPRASAEGKMHSRWGHPGRPVVAVVARTGQAVGWQQFLSPRASGQDPLGRPPMGAVNPLCGLCRRPGIKHQAA